MIQAFEVSKDLKAGKDILGLRIPMSAVRLLMEHLRVPLRHAERTERDNLCVEIKLSDDIISSS